MARNDIKAGSAFVELLLKKKKFLNGLKSAKGQLLGFAKGAAVVGAAITSAAVAAGAVAVRGFLSLGDTLDKMSQRTGFSVEALSELKHAAELSGTSLETVEKGVRGMQRGLLDAERGLSTAVDNLDDLGLSLSELKGLSPEQQFELIASRVAGISDPSQRAAVAMKVFGKAGAELLPLLNSGPDGMARMRKEAQDLGLTMSGDAATSAAKLNDMFSTLWATLKQVAVAVGEALAPLLEQALPTVQAFASAAVLSIRQASAFIGENVSTVTGFIASAWGTLMDWFRTIQVMVLSGVTFVWNNWQVLVSTSVVSAQLSVVRFANQTVHLIGTVIPGWLGWFADNWRDVFMDIANLTATVATNVWNNLRSLWDGIISLFSGDGFTFEWTPLTEGFESAIRELPRIAEREMGPLEQSLQNELDALAGKLNVAVEDHAKNLPALVAELLPEDTEFSKILERQKEAAKAGSDALLAATPAGGSSKERVFASFSSAALTAQGQGGAGPEDKVVKAIESAEQGKKRRDMQLLTAVRGGGLNP